MSQTQLLLKDTEVGSIPQNWNVVELDQVGEVITGTTPKTNEPEYYGGAYMFIAPGDINEDKYVRTTQKRLSEEGLKVSRSLPRNTVLVVCIGATIGKVAMTDTELSATNQQINAIIPNKYIWADYLYYAIKHRSPYLPNLAGRAAVPIVNKSNFAKFLIPLAPLPEQRAIAHILQTIQKAKEARQRELELERERKAALMQYLFTYGTRNEPRKQTEIGEIPKSWQVLPLGEIVTLQRGRDLPVQDRKAGNIPVIGSNGIVGWHEQPSEGVPVPGLATGRSGSIGLLTYTKQPYWPLNTVLYVNDFQGNEPLFLYYWLHLFDFKKYSQGVSVPTLNRNLVHPVPFPLPTLPEQEEIASVMCACDRKITALEKEIVALDELFRAMLEELMTGRLSALPLVEVKV